MEYGERSRTDNESCIQNREDCLDLILISCPFKYEVVCLELHSGVTVEDLSEQLCRGMIPDTRNEIVKICTGQRWQKLSSDNTLPTKVRLKKKHRTQRLGMEE